MRLILSPAKKLREDPDFLPPRGRPALLEQAKFLASHLKSLDYPALKRVLACNDAIAQHNYERYQSMDLDRPGDPAILCYDGIQYQYMAPRLFTQAQFDYVQDHVRILSGLYGVLRPFDGVIPYRLELGARLQTPFCDSLYHYWGDTLFHTVLSGGENTILNLASNEYARALRPYVGPGVRFIDVIFGELDGERLVEKGVYVKMARGEMVRYLAEHNAQAPEDAQSFDRMDYRFSPERSTGTRYVFLRPDKRKKTS